jgi:hypothetical protein
MVASDLSLFTGGLFRHLLLRLGVPESALKRVRVLSIVFLPVVTWVPLLALAAIGGKLMPGSAGAPFLLDLGAHVRMLVVLPLLIIAGLVAEQRIGPTVEQFVSRHLVPDEAMEKYAAAIRSAYRWGDSVIADLVALILIFGVGTPLLYRTYVGLDTSTWLTSSSGGMTLSPAGIWYAYVSMPVLQFLLLRWYYRLFVWVRFLGRVSGLKLQLIPTHPDRVGGLGFLLLATQALSIFAMAHGALLAGWLANRILIRGAALPTFKEEIAIVVVFVLIITIAPLFAFTRSLMLAKRQGVLDYGALASRYVYEFAQKWVRSGGSGDEPLVGSADIQSLADMGGSYELVRTMRSLPITVEMIVVFVVSTLLPVSPLLLTVMKFEDLIKKLISIVLGK